MTHHANMLSLTLEAVYDLSLLIRQHINMLSPSSLGSEPVYSTAHKYPLRPEPV